MNPIADKSNEELWEETLRTAQLLKEMEQSLESMEQVIAGTKQPDKDCMPVQFVSDAQVLTQLLLALKDRGARIV